MSRPNYCDVTIFHISQPSRRISVRLTKKGKANLCDVKRFLNDDYGISIRYTSFGKEYENPNIGWPKWSLYKGEEVPEEYPDSTQLLIDFGPLYSCNKK